MYGEDLEDLYFSQSTGNNSRLLLTGKQSRDIERQTDRQTDRLTREKILLESQGQVYIFLHLGDEIKHVDSHASNNVRLSGHGSVLSQILASASLAGIMFTMFTLVCHV